jgi:histidinol-phosphate aminotransferase
MEHRMIELGDNTGRWGAPPSAVEIMAGASGEMLCGYPEAYSNRLKTALAAYAGVEPEMIVTGCGSDDILNAAIRAFGEPGQRLAMLDPTFVMVPIFAGLHRMQVDRIPLQSDYTLPAPRFIESDASIIYLCSPNNPTGTPIARSSIEAILARTAAVVLLDEAYIEFAGESAAGLVRRFPRLVVARTLSKAFGLAGLRVGYAIAAPEAVKAIERARGPFTVSAMSERAATAVVERDAPWLHENVLRSRAARDRLAGALRSRGIDVPASETNFVFAPIGKASAVAGRMKELGVRVRSFNGLPRFTPALVASDGEALRITAGTDSEIDAALRAFDQARRECA